MSRLLFRTQYIEEANISCYRIFHFVLFIISCIAVHKWRKSGGSGQNHVYIIQQHDGAVQAPEMARLASSLPPPPPGMAYHIQLIPSSREVTMQQNTAPVTNYQQSAAPAVNYQQSAAPVVNRQHEVDDIQQV